MCGGVIFTFNDKQERVFFPNPYAQLPVRKRDGQIQLIPWGRRQQQAGQLPLGGWARLDSIKAGKWEKYQAKPVKIFVEQFMEKDRDKQSHWFTLQDNEFIQGLIASTPAEQRVYVVTVEASETATIHERWPRILTDTYE